MRFDSALRRPAALLLALLIAACERRDVAPDPGPSVPLGRWADTSDYRVVRNDTPVWSDSTAWRLSAEPLLQIGALGGPPEYQLASAHSPVRLADGTIVVANMATNQIRFFDARGRFIRNVGGGGQGPGEFEQLWQMKKVAGDSIMGLSPPTQTSIFTPDGRYIRRFTLDLVSGRPNIWWLGRLEDGTLLAHSLSQKGLKFEGRSPESDGHEGRVIRPERPEGYRDSLMLFRFTMEGKMIDSLGDLPSQNVGESQVFAPNGGYAFHRNRFFHGPGDVFEIRVFSVRPYSPQQGSTNEPSLPVRLERVITRTPTRDLTVTAAHQKAYIDEQCSQINWRGGPCRIVTPVFPARFPAHGRLMTDAGGNLWVQEYLLPGETATRWTVLDTAGRWLGMVDMPERFRPNEIGDDYVLGIWRDEADVQFVRMYHLLKEPARSPR